jgi:hypothetical protein
MMMGSRFAGFVLPYRPRALPARLTTRNCERMRELTARQNCHQFSETIEMRPATIHLILVMN